MKTNGEDGVKILDLGSPGRVQTSRGILVSFIAFLYSSEARNICISTEHTIAKELREENL
uniref:Uncharacterized protein n=1 Tax=Rhizophora mucronata TaxID=61149 RepID=A0A2P2NNF4_RHIMU